MKYLWIGLLGLSLLSGACREELAAPGQCPEQCPGGAFTVRDTIIDPLPGSDTSFVGFVGRNDAPGVLVSTGEGVGEAYAVISFARRPDSITINGLDFAYVVDSVAIPMGIVARDSLATNVRLIFYRLPAGTDSTKSFSEIQSYLVPSRIVDSVILPDTLRQGPISLFFSADSLARVEIPAADSGRLSLAVAVHSETPTGVRLGSRLNANFAPGLLSFVTVDVFDPEQSPQQTIETDPEYTGFVNDQEPLTDPDLLQIGGSPSARALLRFALPPFLKDEANILRATLELTPARPYSGLDSDPAALDVRTVVADLGAKSPPTGTGGSGTFIPASGSGVLQVEVASLIRLWRGPVAPPQVLYLSISPEGFSYSEPFFFSTRSPQGRPRLRITYAEVGKAETP